MPFSLFSSWVQLEIHESHFDKAEEIVKTYISKSTKLADPKEEKAMTSTTSLF